MTEDTIDLREQLIRIDREMAETHKYAAEARKLQHEADKYAAETRKFDREYRWFPWLQLALTAIAAVAAICAAVATRWH